MMMLRGQARRWLWIAIWLAFLAGCGPDSLPTLASPAAQINWSSAEAQTIDFLRSHWSRPLAPQGPRAAATASQGISLAPQSCATCHASQFEDWHRSLHSRAMGPGILGQLLSMPAHARDEHQSCIRCHAPLAEQADSLVAALETSGKPTQRESGRVDEGMPLHEQGLVCAGCHVRKHEWFGPPRRDGSQPAGDQSAAPHGGWTASEAFESSQFCAACHQFEDDGYALDGKLLENTVREWQDSRYARQGASCQSCHMPDRRHLWRGVHDPEMVRGGVNTVADEATVVNGQVASRLSVANTGVGHFFPTYVTPRVVIRVFQQNAAGRELSGTEQQFVIGRQVSLDLSREIADTRIAPDAKAVFEYRRPRHRNATDLVWQVDVQPDAFYLELYASLLRGSLDARSRQLIVQARDNAAAASYQLFSKRLPVR